MSDILSTGNKDLQDKKAMGQVQGQPPTANKPVTPTPPKPDPNFRIPMGPTKDTKPQKSTEIKPDLIENKSTSIVPKDILSVISPTSAMAGQAIDQTNQNRQETADFFNNIAGIPNAAVKNSVNIMANGSNIPDANFNMKNVGVDVGGIGNSAIPSWQKISREKSPAGPTQDIPQGIDWKRVLLTIGDALGGAFKGQAGQQFDSIGMQQALQRQANEQKQKEFEQANEAELNKMYESANIQGQSQQFQNEFDAQQKAIDRQIQLKQLKLEADKGNQQAQALLYSKLLEDPVMAAKMNPNWTKKEKDAYIAEYLKREAAKNNADIARGIINGK